MRNKGEIPIWLSVGSTIAILIGLAAGVMLVQRSQDIRRRAGERQKVTICHMTGSEDNLYVQLEVDANAVRAHLEHGDSMGECPGEPQDDPSEDLDKAGDSQDGGLQDEIESSDNTTSINDSGSNDTGSDDISGDSQEIADSDSQQNEIPATLLGLRIKLQGARGSGNKTIWVKLGQSDNYYYNYTLTARKAETDFVTFIKGVGSNNYQMLVKPRGYLQKKFEDIEVIVGQKIYDLTDRELVAGDFNNDNVLDIEDVAFMLADYGQEDFDNDYDINLNGDLDIEDVTLVVSNYKSLKVNGDE